MHWIIGTAGHIDHGKTSLVKALTGVDTDRLKEEKERGISIDLGFASLTLPDGTLAGVVDVPGHERFIRNMLAGAHGIDLVLFTVAADDGIMPQTDEHFDIVHLLGVGRAVFVITKVDLASDGRVAEVAQEIRGLVAGTALDGSPIVPFACPTGEGLERIRSVIAERLKGRGKPAPAGRFRLPVDRAFVAAGHGLIVTGTAISGEVHPGDKVRCLPSGELLRVRSAEVHGEPVTTGSWGQRIALNLSGSTRVEISRGDVICDEALTLTCHRLDAVLEVRQSTSRRLRDHQRVRVHVGTAERMGKVIPLGSREHPGADSIAPGDRAFCQITMFEPIVAMRGDHFIIRDETAQRTLGGGVVLLPAAPKRKRADPTLLQTLEALEHGQDAALFETIVRDSGHFALSLTALAQLLNDVEDRIGVRAQALPQLHRFTLESDTQYATEGSCTELKAAVLDALRAWHAAQPLSPGVDLEEARASVPSRPPALIFRMLIDELERDGAIVREGNVLHLPLHRVQVGEGDQAIVDRIAAVLAAAPLSPPDVEQLTDELKLDRHRLLTLLRVMERQHQVVAVAVNLYFAADVVARVRDDLARDLGTGGRVTTAAFRDRYQTSRKYAIPLLEYFDRQGVTVRIGDVRQLKQPTKKE